MNKLLYCEEVFRRGDHRHSELVLQGTLLQHLEGRLADKYGLSMLDGLHGAYCEAAAISRAFHLVQHWNRRITYKVNKKKAMREQKLLPTVANLSGLSKNSNGIMIGGLRFLSSTICYAGLDAHNC